MIDQPQRVYVTSSPRQIGVVISVGDVQVAVTPPTPASSSQLNAEQLRTTALRLARRALDVAGEELQQEAG